MADGSKIEWTDATWNIITGCSIISPGCTNCYAMRLAGTRLRNLPSREGLTDPSKAGPIWNGQVRFNEQWLEQPVRWKRSRMIFVCAHGDLFHESVPDAWIDAVFAVMAMAPQHVFQVLTKRTSRMRRYIKTLSKEPADRLHHAAVEAGFTDEAGCAVANWINGFSRWTTAPPDENPLDGSQPRWPLPNVWLGFSAENQKHFDERWERVQSLAKDGWNTWLSAEPLLGPIDATPGLYNFPPCDDCPGVDHADCCRDPDEAPGLKWIETGGESGPNARPPHPAWFRTLRDDAAKAGVPFGFKQWGEWAPEAMHPNAKVVKSVHPTDKARSGVVGSETWNAGMAKVGKKRAGRELDGVVHDAFPERAVAEKG